MKRLRLRYSMIFAVLLLAEILIGTFLHGGIIRAYGGDVLVLPVIYFLVRIFWTKPSKMNTYIFPAVLFLVGAAAELLQAIDVTDMLGIDKGSIFGILIGSVCDPVDMLCYAMGTALIYGYVFLEGKLTKETYK